MDHDGQDFFGCYHAVVNTRLFDFRSTVESTETWTFRGCKMASILNKQWKGACDGCD